MWRDIQDLIASIISHDFDLIISNKLKKKHQQKYYQIFFYYALLSFHENGQKKSGFYKEIIKTFLTKFGKQK
jgi:hypothetical protein